MQALSWLVRLFPYWGLVMALSFLELAMYFRSRGKNAKMAVSLALSLVFIGLISTWFLKRGDLNSGAWVRAWLAF